MDLETLSQQHEMRQLSFIRLVYNQLMSQIVLKYRGGSSLCFNKHLNLRAQNFNFNTPVTGLEE